MLTCMAGWKVADTVMINNDFCRKAPLWTSETFHISDGKLIMNLGPHHAGNLFFSWLSPRMRIDFLRSGSFLAESSLCVTSIKSRNPKCFTTKRGQWSKDSWENIIIFTFCHRVFLPSSSCDLWGTRNVCCEAPKHAMDELFEGTKKVEVVGGFTFVSVTIYNLLDPSASFIAPKLVVVQPNKPTWIMERDPNMGAKKAA